MSGNHGLLVEDARSISEMVGPYLEKEGYRVSYAYDGMEVLWAFRSVNLVSEVATIESTFKRAHSLEEYFMNLMKGDGDVA